MTFVADIGEVTLRMAAFSGILALMAIVEALVPRRERVVSRGRRWVTNMAIIFIDSIAVRLVFPVAVVGTALWAEQAGFGLFNQMSVPGWIAGLIAFVVLDFLIWLQHLVFHKVPVLWRVHRMHHTDVDFDVTTALRFHPIEILMSVAIKMAAVVLLGAPALAVFLFEVVLNGMAIFNHANARLPLWLDRVLRVFIVTPDMHRVHHSILNRETDSNFGFNLSLWDRLFGTYVPQPKGGHDGMTIGLSEAQHTGPTQLVWTLLVPFRSLSRRPDVSRAHEDPATSKGQ
ncbi:MAG: sterol desaturase family protein [Pseudomonadota bacterium]